ncbi:MAG: GNAT family N-acetyltransferase [Bacteroidales bacterium]|nr:GNAT family N-acetyltransferase [Bacteroidales bacterium]
MIIYDLLDAHWAGLNRAVITAFDNERCRLIGLVIAQIPDAGNDEYEERVWGRCCIWNLFVRPDFRRRGIAAKLLQLAEKWGKEQGVEMAELGWREEDTPKEILRWHIRKGYSEVEFGPHSAILEKRIGGKGGEL